VSRSTLVVKKGEPISMQLSSLLSKLGIKPVEVGLSLRVVYDDGVILTGEDLKLDIDAFRQTVQEAHQFAFNLSLEAAITLPENMSHLLRKAHQEAFSLALNSQVANKDTIDDLVRKANTEMQGLSNKLDEAEKKVES